MLTNKSSFFDLAITDAPGYIISSNVLPPIFNLDHCVPLCSVQIQHQYKPSYIRETWNYNAANFDEFRTDLDRAPWHSAYRLYDDIHRIADYWSNLFLDIAKHHVPYTVIRHRSRDKPWMTTEIRKLLRLRDRAWKRSIRTKNPQHENIFKQARRSAKALISHVKAQYYHKLNNRLSNPECTSKEYWKTLKIFLGSKIQRDIPPIIHGTRVLSDTVDKAECFNSYFAEQSRMPSPPDGFALPPLFEQRHTLDLIQTNELEVYKILCSLNVNKANGPDNLSNRLLKEAAPAVAKSLCDVFNASLARGVFPTQWKQSNVIPVFKIKIIDKKSQTIDPFHSYPV